MRKENLPIYTIFVIIASLLLSTLYYVRISFFGYVTVALVFAIIYPMMINLRLERIKGLLKDPKAVSISFIYNFIVTPAILVVLLRGMHDELAMGLMINMLIPGASMSITLAALSEGDVELATVCLATNFLIVPIVLPLEAKVLCGISGISVPIKELLKAIISALMMPLIAGQITRKLIETYRGEDALRRLKPKLSEVSMIAMLAISGLVFYSKGPLIISLLYEFLEMLAKICIYVVFMMTIVTLVDAYLMNYEEHMAIVYVSVGKNNSMAIAISALYFGSLVILPPIAYALIQQISLTTYMRYSKTIKKLFKFSVV